MITLKQLDVLRGAHDALVALEVNNNALQIELDREISTIDSGIDVLMAQIEELKASRTVATAKKDHSTKALRTARERYDAESNKLFKKWEV